MAPVRYSSPSRNQNENNSSQNLHNTMFRRTHWTNEPNNMNWETYHRLQNQIQQLEMEILNWEIEITIRPSTPAH
ncbi:615_t:CDS:1, partial [Entrophospora sp. SA101]